MTQIFRVIKLRSGEELIAEIAGSENGKVTLSKPMIFKTISIPEPSTIRLLTISFLLMAFIHSFKLIY